jgi:hypothetical protein
MSAFLCILKLGYVPIDNDNAEVVPSNIGALRHGFDALSKEDAQDLNRARALWAEAKTCLIEESEDDLGAGATGRIQVEDDHGLAYLGDGCGWPGYYD